MNQKEEKTNASTVHTTTTKTDHTGTNVLTPEDFMTFDFNGIEVKATCENGNPLFLANDICTALGYNNPRKALADHCSYVTKRDIATHYGVKPTNLIYEPDLYALIFGSRLDSARDFQRWVFEDVLPNIRQTGHYTTRDINQPAVYTTPHHTQLLEKLDLIDARLMKLELTTHPTCSTTPTCNTTPRLIKEHGSHYLLLGEPTYTISQTIGLLMFKNQPLAQTYTHKKLYTTLKDHGYIYKDPQGYHPTQWATQNNLAIEETLRQSTIIDHPRNKTYTSRTTTIRLTKTGATQIIDQILKDHLNHIIDTDKEQQQTLQKIKTLHKTHTHQKTPTPIIEVD